MYFLFCSAPVNIPTAMSNLPNEAVYTPKSVLTIKFKQLIQYNDIARGGHFAALEEPELLADDIVSFVEKVENLPSK